MLILNPKIGADIEVFVAEKDTKRIVSAEGYIQGTKEQPFVFDPLKPNFATSLDNVMAEFGIEPAQTAEEFIANIQKSLRYINKILPKELCTAILPAANLDMKFLKTESAKKFGCDPDYNAYTGTENIPPYCSDRTLRSCGGHIHVGWDNVLPEVDWENPTDELRRRLIKMLDLRFGVPSVLLEPDNKRKELYGRAGAYRPKTYGVEYRTPSNFYLQSKELTAWAFACVQDAIEDVNSGFTLGEPMDEVIQNTINFANKEMAEMLVAEYGLKLVA